MFNNDNPIFQFNGPFGIPVQVGGTIILLPLIFVSFSGGGTALMYDLIFVGMLIGSIFLHELGHAWGCRVQGVPVRRIMIHGGGGFCEQNRSASYEQQELIVAMGPIVNLTIWAVASLAAPYFEYGIAGWMLYWLAMMNLFLALFNLLPVHPLDGGKLFQLILLRFLPSNTATRISGGVGLVLAVLWIPGMIWLYFNVGLVLFFFPPVRLHLQMLRLNG
ncbi:MAG: site-2 protease family protein [Sulfitobacter sp.]